MAELNHGMSPEEWVKYSIRHGLTGLLAINLAYRDKKIGLFLEGMAYCEAYNNRTLSSLLIRLNHKERKIAEQGLETWTDYHDIAEKIFAELGLYSCRERQDVHFPWDDEPQSVAMGPIAVLNEIEDFFEGEDSSEMIPAHFR